MGDLHTLEAVASPDSEQRLNGRRASTYAVVQDQALTARIVALSLAAAGMSLSAAADACGVSRNLADAWTDPEGRRGIPLSRVLTMAAVSRRGREAARAILTAALSHVETETGTGPTRDLRDEVVSLAAEAGDVATVVRESLADGVVDESERRRIAAELVDVEEQCRRMRLALIGGDHG